MKKTEDRKGESRVWARSISSRYLETKRIEGVFVPRSDPICCAPCDRESADRRAQPIESNGRGKIARWLQSPSTRRGKQNSSRFFLLNKKSTLSSLNPEKDRRVLKELRVPWKCYISVSLYNTIKSQFNLELKASYLT